MTDAYLARLATSRSQVAVSAALDGIAAGAALRVLYDGSLLTSAFWRNVASRWGVGATTAELATRTLLRLAASRVGPNGKRKHFKKGPVLPKVRKLQWTCGRCGKLGHNRRTCENR